MEQINYEEIACAIVDILPDGWRKTAFFAQYFDGSYCMKFYVDLGNGKYIDCYDISDIKSEDITQTFMLINSIIKPVRNAIKDKWSVMTLIFSDNGDFTADYDYNDISSNSIAYISEWKKKYLL